MVCGNVSEMCAHFPWSNNNTCTLLCVRLQLLGEGPGAQEHITCRIVAGNPPNQIVMFFRTRKKTPFCKVMFAYRNSYEAARNRTTSAIFALELGWICAAAKRLPGPQMEDGAAIVATFMVETGRSWSEGACGVNTEKHASLELSICTLYRDRRALSHELTRAGAASVGAARRGCRASRASGRSGRRLRWPPRPARQMTRPAQLERSYRRGTRGRPNAARMPRCLLKCLMKDIHHMLCYFEDGL